MITCHIKKSYISLTIHIKQKRFFKIMKNKKIIIKITTPTNNNIINTKFKENFYSMSRNFYQHRLNILQYYKKLSI